jgi:hypothetical protein
MTGPFAALMLMAVMGTANADIGQNFAKAGVAVMGGGSYYTNLGPILSSTNQYNYWEINISPEIDFLFLDSTALYVAPYFDYSSTQTSTTTNSGNMYYGADVGVVRYFVLNPRAQSGLVPAIGAAVGLQFDPGVNGKSSGVSYTDKSLYTYLDASASVRLYYFLNDTIAPYISVLPKIWYALSATDSTGTKVTLRTNQSLTMNITVAFGFSYWIPTAKESLGSK